MPSEGDAAAAASSERPVLVKRFKSGKPEWVPVTAELTASLAPLAELCGADLVTVAAAAASQPDFRQQELMRNGLQVAAHLQGLGVEQPQLACLLERCPELFSWPVEERAGVLFGQLMGQGLSAAEAGRCFEQYPGAITSPGFKPAIGVLAELLASGSKEGQAGRQLLADLLRKQPSALALVSSTASTLRKHADNLLNELGLSPQQLVAAVQRSWPLLNRSTKHLAALEAVLQRELGANRSLFRKILVKVPRAVNCSLETVQRRVQALVAVSEDVMWCTGHQLTAGKLVCCWVASRTHPVCALFFVAACRSLARSRCCVQWTRRLGCSLSTLWCGSEPLR